jgi:hypothetical protein
MQDQQAQEQQQQYNPGDQQQYSYEQQQWLYTYEQQQQYSYHHHQQQQSSYQQQQQQRSWVSLSPRDVSEAVWAAGRLQHYNAAFFSALRPRFTGLLPGFSDAQLVDVLWGLAKLGLYDAPNMDAAAQQARARACVCVCVCVLRVGLRMC